MEIPSKYMNIIDSKNTVAARIDSLGNVIVGDGNIILNLKEAAQYIFINNTITELDNRFEQTKIRTLQYPDDESFAVELLKIDNERAIKQKELDTLKKEVIKLAEDFSRININTERLRQAKYFFEQGKFQEARGVLDAEEIESELESLLEKKDKLEKEINTNQSLLTDKSNEFLILARLTAVSFDEPDQIDKTIHYFEKSLKANSNPRTYLAYGHFLQQQNSFKEANRVYNEALYRTRILVEDDPDEYLPGVATLLNNLAVLQLDLHLYKEAKESYSEALLIVQKLVYKNPDIYLSLLSTTLANIANFYSKFTIEQDYAEKHYKEALKIRRKLLELDSSKDLDSLAIILNNLGNLYTRKENFIEGRKHLVEALEIRKTLANKNSHIQLHSVATTLNNLGTLEAEAGDHISARHYFEESLSIVRDLADKNPSLNLPIVATVLNNLANSFKKNPDAFNSEKCLKESLSIYKQLYSLHSNAYATKISSVALNISKFYLEIKPNKELSLSFLKESIMYLLPVASRTVFFEEILSHAKYIIEAWQINADDFFKEIIPDW